MTGKRSRRAAEQAVDYELPDERSANGRTGAGRVRRAVKRSGSPAAASADKASRPTVAAAGPGAGETLAFQAESASPAFTDDEAVVFRTKDGWRVAGDELPDLTCAMVLADLLAAENGMPSATPAKPGKDSASTGEAGRLRATVGQLEHALATRIRVEQAIGVLAERHRIKPRQAFEQLRDAARSRGRRVIDIAGDVVASATNPLLQLPDELSRPRSARRPARQQFGAQ